MNEQDSVVIHVRLPKETHKALVIKAKEHFDLPVGSLARGLIEEGLGIRKNGKKK
jgi:hypothetical protein